jgi:hypothetical protein
MLKSKKDFLPQSLIIILLIVSANNQAIREARNFLHLECSTLIGTLLTKMTLAIWAEKNDLLR